MNILLIFFALPIATIIISIALQRILKCPPLVAAIIFAIFLIVTFIINDLNFLVATIVYTIISFITALIICIICRFINGEDEESSCFTCGCGVNGENNNANAQSQLLNINANYPNNVNSQLLTNSSYDETENNLLSANTNTSYNNYDGDYNCHTINSNGVTTRVNVIPNNYSDRTANSSYRNYRRRY